MIADSNISACSSATLAPAAGEETSIASLLPVLGEGTSSASLPPAGGGGGAQVTGRVLTRVVLITGSNC